jgi:hypothetical protein
MRAERVRNSLVHGGPWTVGALALAHEYTRQLAIRALWQTIDGHLEGRSLAQAHSDMQIMFDCWRAWAATSPDLLSLIKKHGSAP